VQESDKPSKNRHRNVAIATSISSINISQHENGRTYEIDPEIDVERADLL
jgi:hypothetical protein